MPEIQATELCTARHEVSDGDGSVATTLVCNLPLGHDEPGRPDGEPDHWDALERLRWRAAQ